MPKTVVVVVPAMLGGGAERVLSVIMNNLVNKNYKVVLVLGKKNAAIEYKLDDRIIIERNERSENIKIMKPINEISYIRKIMKKYPEGNFISFIYIYNLYMMAASLGLGVSTIVSVRCDPKRTYEKYQAILNRVRLFLYKKANYVVFQTEEARDYFKEFSHMPIIKNPLKEKLPIKTDYNDEKIFVAAGRLDPQKNYKMMFDAMNIVCEKFPEAKLHVYGKGEQEQELKEYCSKLKHGSNIYFKGFASDIHSKLLEAYAYVSSSDYEGISNSMLEALAIGAPCICTDCPVGGARESIDDHVSGILVKVQDDKGMADAMLELLLYPKKREEYGNKAKEIREKLEVEPIVASWEELFL